MQEHFSHIAEYDKHCNAKFKVDRKARKAKKKMVEKYEAAIAKQNNVYEKEVWNAAIEEAAKVADEACERITAGAIRGLKK